MSCAVFQLKLLSNIVRSMLPSFLIGVMIVV